MQKPDRTQLRKLQGIASFQFGGDAAKLLFGKGVKILCSKRTGRIRHIFRGGQLIATLKPKDGYLALTPEGARRLLADKSWNRNLVVVQNDVAEFISSGGDVFAKHIIKADEELRPGEEAIVTNENRDLLAVGRAVLSGQDMKYFKRGVAVKVRKGLAETHR